MELFLFFSVFFFLTWAIGKLLERFHMPWIFASLLLGAIFAIYTPTPELIDSPILQFFGQLGMYFLLFIVGSELQIKKVLESKKLIIKSVGAIITLEGLFGALLIHFFFGYDWPISLLVALSFATVGEAILIPILDKFRMVNSPLGRALIAIGVTDDLVEICALIFASYLIGEASGSGFIIVLIGLLGLVILSLVLMRLKENFSFKTMKIDSSFLLVIFILFLFLSIASLANAEALGALLAGIAINQFFPKALFLPIENKIQTIGYGFFAPFFFFEVGAHLDFPSLYQYFFWVLLVIAVSSFAKFLGVFIAARKKFTMKELTLLTIGLSARFSTSIIIIKLLYDNKVIKQDLYSIIVASSILSSFVIPMLLSKLINRWKPKHG